MNTPAASGSVTRLIRDLKSGDQGALEKLWNRFFPNVKKYAKRAFGNRTRIVRDEEDIASSVLGILQSPDRLAEVNDRDDLLRLLCVMSRNKVESEKRQQNAKSRGGGQVNVVTDLEPAAQFSALNVEGEPVDPAVRQEMNEQYQFLLSILPDDRYREIVRLRVRGKSILEIAAHFDVVDRTIQRKLRLIEDIWIAANGLDEST